MDEIEQMSYVSIAGKLLFSYAELVQQLIKG